MEWEEYLRKTDGRTVRPLLQEAIQHTVRKGKALDLGAGALDDSLYLARAGYAVTAVDNSTFVQRYLHKLDGFDFTLEVNSFQEYQFPNEEFDIVYAGYSLPFVSPTAIRLILEGLTRSLKRGGIFAGDFFGVEDGWSTRKEMTFCTEEELRKLFSDYEILKLEEERRHGKTVRGEGKHWHVFHMIARKRSQ